jgi:hypothetical protein
MTTQSRYHCNLCRDEIVSPEKPGKHGVGIEFRAASFAGTAISFKLIEAANNHLCDDCVRGIAEERKSPCEIDMRADHD